MTVRTIVRSGETLNDAIVRAAFEANKRKDGYEIVCEKCGQPIDDHEFPEDCNTFIKHFGVLPFEA